MIPADTNRNTTVWPLAGLFDALRRDGFQLRPDDYLEVVQVLDAFQPQSQADLQALIAPLIVTSEEEQEKFDRIFERVWQEDGIKSHSVEPKPAIPEPKRALPWGWLTAGLLILVVSGYTAFFWPGPTFKATIQILPKSGGPFEIGDTLVFSVDSSLRQVAGPLARWQWEQPDGQLYSHPNEPTLQVIAQRAGSLTLNLRSQRGRGLLYTTWTDSLQGIVYPICDQLPVIQIDSMRLSSSPLKYRFKARQTGTVQNVQLTQWQLNGSIVASNRNEWEHTFQSGTVPSFYDVRFEAIPDTTQRLCLAAATLSIGVLDVSEPPFTVAVRPTGALSLVPKLQFRNQYFWAIGLAGILLVGLLAFYFWLIWRDSSKKPPQPLTLENPLARFVNDEPPLEIPLENRDAELIVRDQAFYQVVRTLRQPTEGEIRRLHIARSLEATMREGGFPTLVFQPQTAEIEYLFLIDQSQVRSQQVALFEYLFRAFVQENVCVERFFFHKTFDAFTNETHPKGFTLRQLADSYRGHTMVIWSDGYPLLYPPYPVVEPAIRDALADWESRAILTPVPFTDWGSKERALQTDFLLLPADLIGQLRFMQALAENQIRQDAYLNQHTKELYSTEYVDFKAVDELSDYLGDELFQWLAALAIYPRIRWEVVVEVGRALMPPEAVNFTNLLKLARISWMCEGTFPDSTRLELLKKLRPENEIIARQTLLQMLKHTEQYFPGEHFYDGEKYLLQTINQFTLYAHDSDNYADYAPAQLEFKTLYEHGFFSDGATVRYLENPHGNWTTLLPTDTPEPIDRIKSSENRPQNTGLQNYFAKLPPQDKPVAPPVDRRKTYLLTGIGVTLVLLAVLIYLAFKSRTREIDWDQQIPVTIALDTTACVTAQNTSGAYEPRWTVLLNDSLLNISNLHATRTFPLRNLVPNLVGVPVDSVVMQATLSVEDTTAGVERQSSTVQFSSDTLRVRIDCRKIPPVIPPNPNPFPKRIVYIQYASRAQANDARQLQVRLNSSGFTVPGIELRNTFSEATQVRYFADQDRERADSVAQIVKSVLKLRSVKAVNVNTLSKAPIEVWINNGVPNAPFSCSSLVNFWMERYVNWYSVDSKGIQDYTINALIDRSGSVRVELKKTDNYSAKSSGYSAGLSQWRVSKICEQKGVYLIQVTPLTNTTNGRNQAILIRNVTVNSSNLAIVNLDASQLNGPQGQAYFENLLKSARFRRYVAPTPKTSEKAAKTAKDSVGYTNNQAVQTALPDTKEKETLAKQLKVLADSYLEQVNNQLTIFRDLENSTFEKTDLSALSQQIARTNETYTQLFQYEEPVKKSISSLWNNPKLNTDADQFYTRLSDFQKSYVLPFSETLKLINELSTGKLTSKARRELISRIQLDIKTRTSQLQEKLTDFKAEADRFYATLNPLPVYKK